MLKISHGQITQVTLESKNAKFSGYCFYMDTNIWGDFQICISVPLN